MKQKKIISTTDPLKMDAETVETFRITIVDPKSLGYLFDSLQNCFDKSETVTAKHILANQYIDYIGMKIPKLILYMVMEDLFKIYKGRDKNLNNGYYLKFNRELKNLTSKFNVGDIVKSIDEKIFILASGAEYYPDAIVVSVIPFILVSRDSTMKWEATINGEYFEVTGQADLKTLKKCMRRIK